MRSIARFVSAGIAVVSLSGGAITAYAGGTAHAVAPTTIGGNPHPAQSLGPARTGQPNQTCGSATAPSTPGRSAAAPGSAFNPTGTAGSVYAGQQPQNSINTASVAQYDVACARR